ncbi:MAG: glutamate--tRNA ligase [Gemmatimonadales bacterium]|nr:MAG: glutamate--tRNA ligase [Gemmatimonadales bacterium]
MNQATEVRVRFAPSPTGYLHVGGARTALFNWLFARKSRGKFLLRIEDTDRQRSTDEHTRVILEGLSWLGLDWDEEVVFQGARAERHREVAERLLREGSAYEDEGALRFRMPEGEIAFDDLVYGRITFKGEDIKDWVILRSDRTPTYNFSVVVDDIDMKITHVMRGDDHLSNTPKQIAVYRALGAPLPRFAHVPMIHGPDGKKLSKRHGATAVADYRKLGILPAAMRNFLALLGWNPGDDRELFFDVNELIEAFSIEKIQKKAAIFDLKKLYWMNGQYIQRTPPEELLPLVEPELESLGMIPAAIPRETLLRAVEVQRERARTTIDLARRVAIRFDARLIERDEKAEKLIAENPVQFREVLQEVASRLEDLPDPEWQPERLEAELRALAEERGEKPAAVFQPVRVALTGSTVSEPVNLLLAVVGKAETLKRLRAAQEWTAPAPS